VTDRKKWKDIVRQAKAHSRLQCQWKKKKKKKKKEKKRKRRRQQGKATSVQTWTGPEVSRRLRLPDFNAIGI
jgi:hypothetical protein